jgi:putative transposase
VAVRKANRRWAQVRLPKLGWVRFRLSRPLGGTLRNATVSRDVLDWHVCFGVATGQGPPAPNGLPGCGVDFGVACSAFASDETEPRIMPSTLTVGEQRRLLGLERRMACQLRWAKRHNQGRYSARLRRTIAEIAKIRARQARRRADLTHKLTTDLAKRHGWVAIEDMRVKQLTASATGSVEAPGRNVKGKAGLNRSILDNTPENGANSWPTRRRGSGRSCGWCRLQALRRHARRAAAGIRRPGPGAAGCSRVLPADTRRTPT